MTAVGERREVRPYGLWESPITAGSLAQGLRLSEAVWDTDGKTLVWLEGRSDRGVLVASSDSDPAPRDLTSELSVRAFVGYGGGDFTVHDGTVYFISGGRVYRQELAGGGARAVTPQLGEASSPTVSPDGRWLVYVSSFEDADALALVDTDGANWPVKIAQGRDFYMQPVWSADGGSIAWIAWDHPNMPWDGTELWTARVNTSGGTPRLTDERRIAGGGDIAIFQPSFSPDGSSLAYASDETGFGQLYVVPLDGGPHRRLTDGTGEYGTPAWAQGQRVFTWVEGGRGIVAIRSENGFERLQYINVARGEARDIGGDAEAYTSLDQPVAMGERVALTASSAVQPPRVIEVDPRTGQVHVRARSMGETVPPAALSQPRAVTWPSGDGDQAHGLFFPPASERFESAGRPPLIVLVHGGPTSQVVAGWGAQTQYFTTRGYAVLLPNYRGSTGYGRDYMLKLRGNWGVHDVEDARSGALWLAEQGLVDERRRVIMGGSAGGFTVLLSLVLHPGFYTAAISMFGVANQFTLASDTHKFEARYLDSMLGPLPEAAALYRERSPVFHADRIADPIALYQGAIDRVVPKAQSDEIVAVLRRRGVPHEYTVYEGEGHGWRKTETIEAFYTSVDRFLKQYVVFA